LRRILVTGGSGFIGTNLLDFYSTDPSVEALSYDCRTPLDRDHSDRSVQGDVLDAARLRAVISDFEPTELVHLAARTDLAGPSMDDYRANVEGVRVVLECAAGTPSLRRAVFASSRLVCDTGETPISEFDYCPPNCYGRSKVVGEQLVRAYGLPSEWVIVRPTSIWGPWGAAPYRDFFLSLARGTYVHPGRAHTRKHYGFVGNTVYQIDRMLDAPADQVHGRTFYLADPEPIDVLEFATAIRQALGRKPPRSVPSLMLKGLALIGDVVQASGITGFPLSSSRLSHLQMDMLFDLGEMSRVVGPLPWSAQDGIAATIAHLRSQGDIR
jgi:nucleoside-diphosphate-sugar epimerase